MTRYDRRVWVLAACLSAIAGYVDALGFITLGGYFVSFMSGNSTRMAVSAPGHLTASLLPATLIAAFVFGVMLGSFAGHKAGTRRRPVVLCMVSALLALAAGLHGIEEPLFATGLMAVAMGTENAVFERDGEVTIGLTYMTGALVKLGQKITAALLGGDPFAWVPYLLLWLGLVGGAVAGAIAYPAVGLDALWVAAAAAAVLSFAAARIGPGERARNMAQA